MDPITLAILAGTAGTALGNLPALIPSKLQRENKKRLEELQRREAAGELGLTRKEESAISGRLRSSAAGVQREAEDLQKRLLAGGGMATGGQALAATGQAAQQRMALESDVQQKVLEADLAEKQRELDEKAALQAAVEERRREVIGAVGSIAGAGLEAGLTTGAQQAIIQGQKDISPQAVTGLSQQLGVSEEEARGLYELSLENPEMFKYLTALQGS